MFLNDLSFSCLFFAKICSISKLEFKLGNNCPSSLKAHHTQQRTSAAQEIPIDQHRNYSRQSCRTLRIYRELPHGNGLRTSIRKEKKRKEKNKTYNIDRIGSVEYLNQKFQHEAKREKQVMDDFGFAYNGQKYPVKLEMSMKEYLLLKAQYPLIAPFVKYESGKDKYVLEVEVNDLRPLEGFNYL